MLGPLADNGGLTQTHALSSASPAIDQGINARALTNDQRGPGFPRTVGPDTDIGAFEYSPAFLAPTLAKSFTPDTITVGDTSTLTITLTNPNASAATLQTYLVDTFPIAMVIASADTASTCPGAMIGAVVGEGTLAINPGAQIPGSGNCTVSVTVTVDTAGNYVNTIPSGALQTDEGNNAEAATAALEVNPISLIAPSLSKAFAPATIQTETPSTLTITLHQSECDDSHARIRVD